jgi:hypothetical protein
MALLAASGADIPGRLCGAGLRFPATDFTAETEDKYHKNENFHFHTEPFFIQWRFSQVEKLPPKRWSFPWNMSQQAVSRERESCRFSMLSWEIRR